MVYPIVLKTGALKDVFSKIKTTGVPSNFTTNHLKSLGFTSSNDVAILSALRFVGFIDASGKPTDKYIDYRGKDGKKILAEGIKGGYSELFQLYPDAEQKDEESLMHFFATKTDASENTRKVMIGTFKALCSISDFKNPIKTENTPPLPGIEEEVSGESIPPKAQKIPVININIELQIPATNDAEIYKNFFEAMKKYLID